jgi:HD-like signal output (HDOD) protein
MGFWPPVAPDGAKPPVWSPQPGNGLERLESPLSLNHLPPFPAVALRALQLASDANTRLRELHEVIRTDPAFSSELLRIANSPLYGIRVEIKNTLQATMLLGFDRVRAVALTLGLRTYLGHCLEVPALRACWRHSLAAAILAEELAPLDFLAGDPEACGGFAPAGMVLSQTDCGASRSHISKCALNVDPHALPDKGAAYTAAIVHDVGRLSLAVLRSQEYASVLERTEDEPRDLLQCERELFGMDHCQAGRALALAWNFPKDIVEVIARHHEAMEPGGRNLLAVVQFSCLMADALGFRVGCSPHAPTYEALYERLSAAARHHFGADADQAAFRLACKINKIESV